MYTSSVTIESLLNVANLNNTSCLGISWQKNPLKNWDLVRFRLRECLCVLVCVCELLTYSLCVWEMA